MQTILKLLLSLLLLLCLADMPYSYYQFVRFVACIAFGYFAFGEQEKQTKWALFYIALAILFQPFIKISLGRVLWNVVDVIVAVILLYSIVLNKKSER
jgi:hypothetical protein